MTVRHPSRGDKTPLGGASYGRLRLSHTPKEDTDVLPPPCDRMDDDHPAPLAPFDQATRHGLGPVEPGDGLARSWALTAVSAFLATWLGCKEPAVRQQWRECCYEATAKRGTARCALAVEPCVPAAWVVEPWEGPQGRWPSRRPPGHALYRLGAQRGLSRRCSPSGLDRPGGHGHTCLAVRVVAHAAPGAPGGSPVVDGHRPGRPGLGRPLAVAADRPAGGAPVFAPQHGGHLAAPGPGAWGGPEDLGARAGHGVAGNRHRLQRPSPPAALHPAGLRGGRRQRAMVAPD